jgi:predicted ATPase
MTARDLADRDSGAREDAGTIYAQRAQAHQAARQRLDDRSRTISYARVTTFLAGAACVVVAMTSGDAPTGWLYGAGAALLLAFLALVAWHSAIERRERRHRALAGINQLARHKLHRDWSHVPAPAVAAPASHPYAEDLDLFGRASLFALLWSGGTESGRQRLADWLLQPGTADEVRVRQQAVEELAPLIDLRQEMLAAARTGALDSHEAARFLEWAESAPWLSRHPPGTWLIRALTLAILLLIVLQLTGVVHRTYWLAPVVAAFAISNVLARRVEDIFNRAFAQHAVFRSYAELFHLVSSAEFRSPLLRDLQAALVADRLTAERQMARLQRLMELADLRHSALLHLPVQVLTLWDFHVVSLVERWQAHAGRMARRWFDALATCEALATLAVLRFDNPSWAFPEIDDTGDQVLDAAQLGHPLLAPGSRVDNDVRIGPPGTFLLVTGSNMSGKSTLLRAIGVNVVLAQAGSPVCAARLRLPPVRLHTSMRVQDSLEQGVSFFMAAVQRLKRVVEAAEAPDRARQAVPDGAPHGADRGSPRLLYLLDEVLQGTNTAERQIAVRSIVRHLLARPAIGAVTTHDLTLAATPELAASAQSVHFTEHLQEAASGASMTFDYRLRPGLATSRNALRLMQMVGLEVETTDEG